MPLRSAGLMLIVCSFASLAACGGGDDGTVPVAEIGTGTVDWEPVTAEQDLVLVAGPQGGHHFVLHARVRGIDPGDPDSPGDPANPSTLFEIFDRDGRQVDAQFPPYKLGYRNAGAGWLVLPSGRIVQLIEGEVEGVYGERMRVVVRVTDEHGNQATDERWITAVEDLDPPDLDPDAGVADASP